jgi:hypothetical protein
MGTRLALVNCKGPTEGPWTIAKGNESGLEIFNLGEGALVRLECEVDGVTDTFDFYKSGEYPLPGLKFNRYRVSKLGDPGLATIVRVQLNGKS